MAPRGAHTTSGRGTKWCPPGLEVQRFVSYERRVCCTAVPALRWLMLWHQGVPASAGWASGLVLFGLSRLVLGFPFVCLSFASVSRAARHRAVPAAKRLLLVSTLGVLGGSVVLPV